MSIGVCATYEFSKIDPDRVVKWCHAESGECELRKTPVTVTKEVLFCINPFEEGDYAYRPAVMAEALEVVAIKYKHDGGWGCMSRIIDGLPVGNGLMGAKKREACVSPANVSIKEDNAEVFLSCFSSETEQEKSGMEGIGVVLGGTLVWAYCQKD